MTEYRVWRRQEGATRGPRAMADRCVDISVRLPLADAEWIMARYGARAPAAIRAAIAEVRAAASAAERRA